jgi:hypothetical protein
LRSQFSNRSAVGSISYRSRTVSRAACRSSTGGSSFWISEPRTYRKPVPRDRGETCAPSRIACRNRFALRPGAIVLRPGRHRGAPPHHTYASVQRHAPPRLPYPLSPLPGLSGLERHRARGEA